MQAGVHDQLWQKRRLGKRRKTWPDICTARDCLLGLRTNPNGPSLLSFLYTAVQHLGNLPSVTPDHRIMHPQKSRVLVTIYRHSGRFTVGATIFAGAMGLAGGLPLAFIYSWGVIRIPEVKLACIATMAFGAMIGVVTGLGARWGKVRNLKVAAIAAMAAASGSHYCGWAFWIKNVFHTFAHKELSALVLMQRPLVLWRLVKLTNEYGTWGMSQNSPTTGTALWVIWVLEAAAVLSAAALAAVAVLQHQPFCEACGLWCSSSEKLCLSAVADLAQTKLLLNQHDLSFLQELRPGNKKTSHLNAQLQSCGTCGELNTLTLQQIHVKPRKFGAPQMQTVNLVTKLIVSRPEAEAFRQTAQGHKQLSQAAHA